MTTAKGGTNGCENCYFMHRFSTQGSMYCHRYPPRVTHHAVYGEFPKVTAQYWCGEWAPQGIDPLSLSELLILLADRIKP